MDLARVCVVGSSGSGKTTFARALAERLGAPHREIDALYWLPGWTEPDRDEFRARVGEAVMQERWVMDGNFGSVRDVTWARATTIVWLDYSFPRVFGRLLRRTIRRAWTREELFGGRNRESWRQSFLTRDSVLWWMITHYRRYRREFRALRDEYPIVVLRHPRDADAFLERVVTGA